MIILLNPPPRWGIFATSVGDFYVDTGRIMWYNKKNENERNGKPMKKFSALLLVMLILLAGCNTLPEGNDGTGNSETPTTQSTEKPTETATKLPAEKPTEQTPPTEDVTEGPELEYDIYENIDIDEFYENYTPAVSASDAYYRTQHNLMSGDIFEQDQAPTMSDNRPMQDGKYIRNTSYKFSDDGDAYYVYNSEGVIVNIIYRDGAYVTLEEVAAYVYAYGTIPPNYTSKKRGDPEQSPWGIYLRLNNSKFSGNTSKYPYEPKLPDISGCGGDLQYYEIDIGTTGTTSGNYAVRPYNDGLTITRGAARIVYTHQDKDNDGVIEIGEVYVFYTYNHYNDFQEYLNYENGWGEMFGNITGGGELSDKTNYNPTPYVETTYADFSSADFGISAACISLVLPYVDIEKRQFV